MSHSSSQFDPDNRADQARLLVHEYARRRAAGERISDAEIISSHGELAPQLEAELRKRAVIAQAFQRADCEIRRKTTVRENGLAPALQTNALLAIPGYAIVGEVHRGGQGVVYRAIQQTTGREVAIKVLLDGRFAGERELARFEREVRILAGLRHPNIVTIHDSGVADGRAYFVMDYIAGCALDEYLPSGVDCDAVVRSFVPICDAVNAAHLKGVIHRDLKPSNIRIDEDGRPHVLDFGLAKQDADDDSAAAVEQAMTQTGQFLGSLPWSSPEQAAGRSNEVDMRSDVYSLGVVLYQLLTDKFPYEVRGSLDQVVANIIHAEPIRPRAICRQIGGELETIVLKCLHKQPERRYQNAGELGRDLQRLLNNEPIEARRDSAIYLLGKIARRNKLPIAFAAIVVALLATSTVILGVQAHKTTRARIAAESVTDFLQTMLASVDPMTAEENRDDVTVREILAEASARIDAELSDQPEAEAAVRETLGRTYTNLGRMDEAHEHLERALKLRLTLFGDDDLSVAGSRHDLAELFYSQARYADAETECAEALAIRREYADENSPAIGESLALLTALLREQGRLDEAEAAGREAVETLRRIGGKHAPLLARGMNALASVLRARGNLGSASDLYRETLELRRAHLAPDHPDIATSLNNLAGLCVDQDQYDAAQALYEESLAIIRARIGEQNTYYTRILSNLSRVRVKTGAYDEAERGFEEALRIRRELTGEDDSDYAAILNELAQVHLRRKNYAAAEPLFEQALQISRNQLGDEHPTVATMLLNLGVVRNNSGAHASAEECFRLAVDIRRRVLGPDEPDVASVLMHLAAALRGQKRGAEAVAVYEEALRIRRTAFGDRHTSTVSTLGTLARSLKDNGDVEAALPHYRELLEIRHTLHVEPHVDVARSAANVADLLVELGRYGEAAPVYREALEIAQKCADDDDRLAAAIRSDYGACLIELNRFDEAEAQLSAAYKTYAASPEPDDELVQRCIERLAQLFERSERPAQAAEWRARLLPAPSETE